MKHLTINLTNNNGYKWHMSENIYVKGYIYDNNNVLFTAKKLVQYFLSKPKSFEDKLINANGIFAVVIKENSNLKCAVDKNRSIPLFYETKKNRITISDTNRLKKNSCLESFSIKEFSCSSIVSGKETLLKNVYQVQAGEYIELTNDVIKTKFYYEHAFEKLEKLQDKDKLLTTVLDNLTQRLIKKANGRKLIIPLSGGYDSRLIATLLKKHNYKNVLCFTYGNKHSQEVKISEKVAKKLEFKWIFIEYNEALIKAYTKTEIFRSFFFETGSNFSSLAHIQDFFAVKALHNNYNLTKDAIFVPGHSLDVIAGSLLNKKWKINSTNTFTLKCILALQYHFGNYDKFEEKLTRKLNTNLPKGIPYTVFESWSKKERQAKFIINSVRVYEVFDYEFLLPLWDAQMVDFFRKLPLTDKINKVYFDDFVLKNIFKEFNVAFKVKKTSFFKRVIRKLFSKKINNRIHAIINKKTTKDPYGFKIISKELGFINDKHINTNLINYYLDNLSTQCNIQN